MVVVGGGFLSSDGDLETESVQLISFVLKVSLNTVNTLRTMDQHTMDQ